MVLAQWQKLSYCVRRGDLWGPIKAIETPGWKYFEHVSAVLDSTGRPLVIWTGFDGLPGEALAAMRWTGSAWSTAESRDHRQFVKRVGWKRRH
ncbi:MAG: hypothetical protein AB1716_14915 [Planctomycetota bacterium]